MSEMNYYEEKINEIKELMKTDIKKADALLDVELNMPYIPEKYEAEFVNLKDAIIYASVDSIQGSKLTDEQTIEYLFSDDQVKEASAIDNLSKINIRNYLADVKRYLDTKGETNPIARAFIYEILVAQQIDIELEFDGVQLNPLINKSILDDEQVRIALSVFENEVEEEPHMLKTLIDEFRHYLLSSFPNLPKNGEAFAKDFAVAFKSLFNDKIELTEEQQAIQTIIKS